MKKRILLFLTTFAFLLTSCSGGGGSSSNNDSIYTIKWVDYDGNLLETSKVKHGEMPIYTGETPTKNSDRQYTYHFSGWFPTIHSAIKNETYRAEFSTTKNKYVVTWKNLDEIIGTEIYEYGEIPTYKGETPTRGDSGIYTYTFSDWEPKIKSVTSDVTYNAQYKADYRKFKVSWLNYDGSLLYDEYYDYNTYPTFKEDLPFKPGNEQFSYSFTGWLPALSKIKSDVSYTAQFSESINTYTITWKNYDGGILSVETYEYGKTPIYKGATPTKPNDDNFYAFDGWEEDIKPVSSDYTYTAKFAIGFNIQWANYDGQILKSDIVKAGEMPIYTGDVPTKPCDDLLYYNFETWSPLIEPATCNTTYVATFTSNAILEFGGLYDSYYVKSCNYKYVEHIVIPSIYKGFPVKSIYPNAFSNCPKLKTIVVPDSITSIHIGAFSGCSKLEKISLPFVGLKASATEKSDLHFGAIFGINYNSGSTETWNKYMVPNGLREVVISGGSVAYFESCTMIESIELPNSIKQIDCSKCTELKNINIPESVASVNFSSCWSLNAVVLPNSITTIEDRAFAGCRSLTNITFNKKITSIGSYAFSGCSSLPFFEIPDTVTKIGDYAFKGCSLFNELIIGDQLLELGSHVFDACSSLKTLTLPFVNAAQQYDSALKSVTITGDKDIPNNAFYNENSIETINIIGNTKRIGTNAFHGCSYLINLYIPDSVTFIAESAFEGCSNLTNLNIGNNGNYKLVDDVLYNSDMTELLRCLPSKEGSFKIPDSVITIQKYAFQDCVLLTSVTIPETVQTIGKYIFDRCKSIQNVTLSINSKTSNIGRFFNSTIYDEGDTKIEQRSSLLYTSRITYFIPQSLRTISITSGKIFFANFNNFKPLKHIIVSDRVEEIESEAFGGIDSLTSLTLPFVGLKKGAGNTQAGYFASIFNTSTSSSSNYAKVTQGNSNYLVPVALKTVSITGNDTIRNQAFINCTPLEMVNILGEITSIPSNCFKNCSSLISISLPNSLISIGDYAFAACKSLTSITIPNSVTSLGNYVFSDCTSLISVNIPDGIETFDCQIFNNCNSLKSIYFGKNLNAISNFNNLHLLSSFEEIVVSDENNYYRFINNGLYSYDLKALIFVAPSVSGSFVVENGVNKIYNYAFQNCTSLTSVTLPDSVNSIGINVFQNCTSLTSVTFSGNLNYLGSNAFQNCTSLTSVTLPDNLNSIERYTFQNCTSLASVTLPENLTNIYEYAFFGCSSLNDLVIPHKVQKISCYAFQNCFNLKKVILKSNDLYLEWDVFRNCSIEEIVVPLGVHFTVNPFCDTLKFLYYCGSQSDWIALNSKISIDIVYFYSEDKPTDDGNYWRYVDGAPSIWQN